MTCAQDSQCFTELHPNYIRRGCAVPDKPVRNFVCKCPLCNDKSAADQSFYNYNSIAEWEYHNQCLQIAMIGVDLVCKVCATRGTNTAADALCKAGKA